MASALLLLLPHSPAPSTCVVLLSLQATRFFRGAETIKTAELTAMLVSLRWLKANFAVIHSPPVCILEYDSEYAAAAARRCNRVHANATLVIALRHAFSEASTLCHISLRKAESHMAVVLNKQADKLGPAGSTGFMVGGFETLAKTNDSGNTA